MGQDEQKRLADIAAASKYAKGVNYYAIQASSRNFRRYLKPGSLLELGPAEGVMTQLLYPDYQGDYSVVDGAERFVKELVERYPQIKGYTSLFEAFEPGRTFDNILLGHVLEHVENPVEILKRCKKWLEKGGRILAAVPNCNSIHRQAAVKMGLLDSVKQLNEADLYHGHRRVYSKEEFEADFTAAGFHILKSGGYWLKPLSNQQIEETWDEKMIAAFMELGEEYPSIAAELYIAAE